MRPFLIVVLLVSLATLSCRKDFPVVGPDSTSNLFMGDTKPFKPATRAAMEGVYRVVQGQEFLGDLVALKWSGVANGPDTSFYLSGFFAPGVGYFVVSAGSLDSTLFFTGEWHKLQKGENGLFHGVVLSTTGGKQLLNPVPVIGRDSITIGGTWGNGEENPTKNFVLQYDRPLYNGKTFDVLGHRGGGRTSDLLPVSENSVDMILYAERLGCTAIEIDVHPTKDGVPVLYHDNTLNLRLIQKCGLVGAVADYTYDQLQGLVRLIHGERIPMFREVLDAALYRTKLRMVYIDTKPDMPMVPLYELQQEYMTKAAAAGRQFEVLIGVPSDDKLNEFKTLPNYTQIPSICELTVDDTRALNSRAWCPRFTLGTQDDLVAQVHGEGRRAYAWTVDDPQYIQQFMAAGYDGLLTNYASLVAYYHYVHQ